MSPVLFNPALRARLQIIAGALLFSTGGLAIKAVSFDGWQVSGLRSGFAVIALLIICPLARQDWSWRTLVAGIPYAATFILFSLANKFTTPANTIFLQDTAPIYLLLLAPWLLSERPQRRDIWFMITLAVGMLLFFARIDAPTQLAPDPLLGNILAASAGLTWALTLLSLRWLAMRSAGTGKDTGKDGNRSENTGGKDHPIVAVLIGNLIACLVSAMWAFPIEGAGMQDWLITGYLGVFQIAFAYVLVTSGIRHLTALETSLVLLLEPVLNPIWVWLILAEVPGSLAIAGGSIILIATALRTVQQTRAG